MEPLDSSHLHFLRAAEGWVELGNVVEARAELAQIPEEFQNHAEILGLRWTIASHEEDWQSALKIARTLVKNFPESAFGWLHQAYALRRVPEGGLQAAWDCLLPALHTFPTVAIIPYNLACYACQLQNLDKARELFYRAMAAGNKEHLKRMALQDADLQALWAEIPTL